MGDSKSCMRNMWPNSSEVSEFILCVLRNLGVGSVNFGVRSIEGELVLLFKSGIVYKLVSDSTNLGLSSIIFIVLKGLLDTFTCFRSGFFLSGRSPFFDL